MNLMIHISKALVIVCIFFFGASITFAEMPMIDRGDGYAVYPNAQKNKIEKLKEAPKSLFNLFEELSSSQPSSGNQPTNSPLPTSIITTPGVTTSPGDTSSPIDDVLTGSEITYSAATIESVRKCLQNMQAYKIAESRTGVDWKVIAGIHYMEGNCGNTKSCVSGRTLGVNEPDLYGNCSAGGGEGKPVPLPGGGCGFRTLVDSCIYGGNHLRGKIQGKVPRTVEELAYALGRYNGLGNRNCKNVNVSNLPFCPPSFDNDDHIYPMSKFDKKHETMYLVYCADYTKCNPPKIFQRIGALSVARILSNL